MMMVAAIRDSVRMESDGAPRANIDAVFADALNMSVAALVAEPGTMATLRALQSAREVPK
jgi:hypothetical protein